MKIKVSTPLGYKRLHRNSKPKQGDAWIDNSSYWSKPVEAFTAIEKGTFKIYGKHCFFFRPINTNLAFVGQGLKDS